MALPRESIAARDGGTMSSESDRRLVRTVRRVTAACVLTLLAALLPVALPQSGVSPAGAAASNSTLFGVAVGPSSAPVSVTVELFSSNWTYLTRTRSTSGGVFRFSRLPAGTYHLQASDNRQRGTSSGSHGPTPPSRSARARAPSATS